MWPVIRAAALIAGLSCAATAHASGDPPETPRHPVTNTYHGVVVVDDYQWLENAEDPAVREWTARQNVHTRALLDRWPGRDRLRARVEELTAAAAVEWLRVQPGGEHLFALKDQPPRPQPILVALDSLDDPESERVILDPVTLDEGGTTSIEGFHPSPDGRLVAVILATGGSEQGTLHLFETATGAARPDILERVAFPTGGGSVAWEPDGSGLFYTRYPAPGERPPGELAFHEQVYRHRLGTPQSEDTHVIGREFPRIAEVFLRMRGDGAWLLVTVQDGDSGRFAHWLRSREGAWSALAGFSDDIKAVVFGPDDSLFLFTRRDAPRGRIDRVPLDPSSPEAPRLAGARTVVPESDAVISGYEWRGLEIVPNFVATRSNLFVQEIVGGPSRIRVFNLDGSGERTVPLPPVAAVDSMVALPPDSILFRVSTYLEPPAWYRYDAAGHTLTRTALAQESAFDFADAEVIREFATSKDGTRVPLSIIRRKNTRLDGGNPVLLTGYGGYGINVRPRFLGPRGRIWLDHGGILAVANLRGGGEFGEQWHEAGRLTRKQNVFDDFAACARHLIERRHTRPELLAITGASNGGLLMGAALTQHPELFRAVVTHVGIYDMLRVELDPNGAFNIPEFGTVRDPDQFRTLHAYSPYHRVVDGTAYPAVFLLTGENDGRVNPANSRKMTARLQAATSSSRPILLRTSATSGHGRGTALDEQIALETDVLTFLMDQLEIPLRP